MNCNDSVLVVSSKEELIAQGYIHKNIGKEFIYSGKSFILKQPGVRVYSGIPLAGYAGFKPQIAPRLPKWILKLDELTMEISIFT